MWKKCIGDSVFFRYNGEGMEWRELWKGRIVLAALGLLALGAFLILVFWAWQAQQREEPALGEEERELTKEEILERLSAPEGAESRYVSDPEFLKSNSAPSGVKPKYTDDEEFIQRFSAPEDAQPKYLK